MSGAAVRTDKGFQLMVLAGIAVIVTAMVGIALQFMETTTITTALIVLLAGVLISIAYVALEL